jgi:hypothetical protein
MSKQIIQMTYDLAANTTEARSNIFLAMITSASGTLVIIALSCPDCLWRRSLGQEAQVKQSTDQEMDRPKVKTVPDAGDKRRNEPGSGMPAGDWGLTT